MSVEGFLELGRIHIQIYEITPTQELLDQTASYVKEYVQAHGAEYFDVKLTYKVYIDEGSIIGWTGIFLSIASIAATMVTANYDTVDHNIKSIIESVEDFGDGLAEYIGKAGHRDVDVHIPDHVAVFVRKERKDMGVLGKIFSILDKYDYSIGIDDANKKYIENRLLQFVDSQEKAENRSIFLDILLKHPNAKLVLESIFGKGFKGYLQNITREEIRRLKRERKKIRDSDSFGHASKESHFETAPKLLYQRKERKRLRPVSIEFEA